MPVSAQVGCFHPDVPTLSGQLPLRIILALLCVAMQCILPSPALPCKDGHEYGRKQVSFGVAPERLYYHVQRSEMTVLECTSGREHTIRTIRHTLDKRQPIREPSELVCFLSRVV